MTWLWARRVGSAQATADIQESGEAAGKRSKCSDASAGGACLEAGGVTPVPLASGTARDSLSFASHQTRCRAVPLAKVTRNCGRILNSSRSCDEVYKLSRKVATIKTFISHNWIVGRYRKWSALSFHFNFEIAAITSILACTLVTILTIVGSLPAMTLCDKGVQGAVATFISGPVFFLALFFSRDLFDNFGIPSPDVFVDRACIRQTDHKRQSKSAPGDLQLAALLHNSRELLVVYTNVYLRKLWTVYEVAAFAIQRPDATKHIKVLPVSLTMVVLVQFALCYLWAVVVVLLLGFGTPLDNRFVPAILAALEASYLFASRRWQREKLNMKESILHFKVRDCICSIEADRHFIHENIAVLLRGIGLVAPTATLDEALDTFDALMQNRSRHAFASAFSRFALEYRHYVFFGFLMWGSIGFDQIAGIALNPSPRFWIAGLNTTLHRVFIVIPVVFVFQEYLMSCKLHWVGAAEACWVTVAFIAVWTLVHLYHQLLFHCEEESLGSDCKFAMMNAIGVTSTLIGFILLLKQRGASSKAASSPSLDPQAEASVDSEMALDHEFPHKDVDDGSVACSCSMSVESSIEEQRSEFSL